ncbi:MAG: hypothetical protein WCO04_10555 [Pseudomonadota bacterium]
MWFQKRDGGGVIRRLAELGKRIFPKQQLVDYRQTLKDRFFRISNVADLKKFENALDKDDPFSMALAFLIKMTFDRSKHGENGSFFAPREVLSEDLSSAVLGNSPIVFLGTNEWAIKPYLSKAQHMLQIKKYCDHINNIRNIFSDKKIVLSVIPEKDYVIDKIFYKSERFFAMDEAISDFSTTCSKLGIAFVFNEYIAELRHDQDIGAFNYPDSHLPSLHYLHIFENVIKKLGLDTPYNLENFSFKDDTLYGDLALKFGKSKVTPVNVQTPCVRNEDLTIIAGTPSFGSPLGTTWQSIENRNALITGKVLILGDSHSSILAQKKLTYLYATTFERCDFFWNPLGTRSIPEKTDADFVILEISQRFLF